jgi:hypothetical protein
MKTYSKLIRLTDFKERYEYLKIGGILGEKTFGYERWMNQAFYKSPEWLNTRHRIIARDLACDLAMVGREITGYIIVHHINPVTKQQMERYAPILFNPENLICCSHDTHNAIHYGNGLKWEVDIVERYKNDTIPWRR